MRLFVRSIALATGLGLQLRQHGISRADLPRLAEDAMQQQLLLANNPREMTYADALSIYEKAY